MTADFIDIDDDILDDGGQIEAPRRGRKPKVYAARAHQKRTANALFEPAPSSTSVSWWLGKSGEAFRRAAADEQARMQKSKDGRKSGALSGVFD